MSHKGKVMVKEGLKFYPLSIPERKDVNFDCAKHCPFYKLLWGKPRTNSWNSDEGVWCSSYCSPDFVYTPTPPPTNNKD